MMMFRLMAVGLAGTAAGLAWTGASGQVTGQVLGGSTITLTDARVVGRSGETIEGVTVQMAGGQIAAVRAGGGGGSGASGGGRGGFLNRSREIDLDGRYVTAGLIDAEGTLGMSFGGDPDARALAGDAFDPFAEDSLRAALRRGVTAVFVPARGPAGVNGVGQLIRLSPREGGGLGRAMEGGEALCVEMGSGEGAVARLRTFAAIVEAFEGAKAYRESLEVYEEQLEKYTEELKKIAEENKKLDEAEKKGADTKGADTKGADTKGADTKGADTKGADTKGADTKGADTKGADTKGGEGQGGEKKEGEEKGPEKPKKPARDGAAEVLLRALDREIAVRFSAEGSAEIVSALEIAGRFGLRAVIVGGAEAHLVAGAIGEAGASVVLDAWPASEDGVLRRAGAGEAGAGAVLSRAGVTWSIGTGAKAGATAFVLEAAAIAQGDGAIARATEHAAATLGLGDRLGRLATGRSADVVVWTGHPLDPESVVEAVYVGGEKVYDRADDVAAPR